MQVPVQITLRDNLPHTEAVEAHVQEKIAKLQLFCHNIIACHVVIELSNKKQHQGNLHNTRVTIAVPGKELVSKYNEDENMYVSIREAFEDMTRQLEEYVAQMRGEMKNHQSLLSGKIVRLFHADGFGFIEGHDGTEFYFNANHVSDPAFNHLSVGMSVHFIEGEGTDGPQAHRVKRIESPAE
ncbi:MAG: ribosome-associated translation inhibitor RaiA [Coxiellaceae bacterium]|nr:ribosome-associated translation inhibitor RaiA [Coxiellaceae bacterium]